MSVIELPADPRSPAEARRVVEQTLHQWHLDETDDVVGVAQLLTSELVTNSLLHAGSPVRLVIALDDRMLRIEAHDRDRAEPVRRPTNEEANSGRGLMIMEALAEDWGTRREPDGKVVWFRLRL